jgi:hypothetical protein
MLAILLRLKARRIDAWRSEDGIAAPVPKGLQASTFPEEMRELIPYGTAKLPIAAFPQLQIVGPSTSAKGGASGYCNHANHATTNSLNVNGASERWSEWAVFSRARCSARRSVITITRS